MAITLYHVGRRPGQPQFGLDTFTEIWKANDAADVVSLDASVPQRGDAHPDYPHMFVTDRYFNESGENACALDIVYTGCMKEDGGDPVLPPIQNSSGRAIQSATTYTSSAIFPLVATVPASVQYYAPTNVISQIYTASTSADEPADPDDITSGDLITWTLVAEQPASDLGGIMDWLLNNAFVQRVTETVDTQEIVAGQYWQITKRKTKVLLPYAPS